MIPPLRGWDATKVARYALSVGIVAYATAYALPWIDIRIGRQGDFGNVVVRDHLVLLGADAIGLSLPRVLEVSVCALAGSLLAVAVAGLARRRPALVPGLALVGGGFALVAVLAVWTALLVRAGVVWFDPEMRFEITLLPGVFLAGGSAVVPMIAALSRWVGPREHTPPDGLRPAG